jgi:hypothetical protein
MPQHADLIVHNAPIASAVPLQSGTGVINVALIVGPKDA